uniref:NADH-ubiquinone oxidoreductase chain 2 n=1 Tax=Humbertiella nada TaxID=1848995 RepID=A0A172QHI7_9NEOP|nr:NADH dehydrogenase subunit 2 [Humbertiella nada]AND97171.1 NADH dehydrogenase subunit 2 [Humbertiella nada]
MSQNSTKILFLTTLISGMIITLSANSWMSAWMGLEINLLSFIPLMSSAQNMLSNEASLKYFLIQAIASSSLLFFILLKIYTNELFYLNSNFWNNFLMTPLLMKIAGAPLHWWLPSVTEGLSWGNSFILLSIQKIAPLTLISYLLSSNFFIQAVIISSAILGAIGGFNQISLRKILSFSSINHIGWMLVAMITGTSTWLLYFSIYFINIAVIILLMAMANLTFITQTFNFMGNLKLMKSTLFISMLSLGGLPPFLGFFPKWITIQTMIQNTMFLPCLILILSSLLTLFYYMRIMFTALILTNSEMSWSISISNNQSSLPTSLMMGLSFIILGMLICTLTIWTF